MLWSCDICKKVKVEDKGKGFRAFVKYRVVSFLESGKEKYPMFGEAVHQIRICDKCLKKDYKTIILS